MIKAEEEKNFVRYVQTSFSSFQQEAVDLSRSLSQDSVLVSNLDRHSPNVSKLFERLQSVASDENTIEIYTTNKVLLSWIGNEGIKTDPDWLKPKAYSFITQGPIFSYLLVVTPIQGNGGTIGYILIKRLFDVQFPISNRFINEDVFTSTFTSRFDVDAGFVFSSEKYLTTNEDTLAVPLLNTEGNPMGYALLHHLTLDERTEKISTLYLNIIHGLELALLLLLLVGVSSHGKIQNSKVFSSIWGIFAIWTFRYALVFTNVPGSFFDIAIFNPALFASSFGYGIAKSIGDLFLTAVSLSVTIGIIVGSLLRSSGTSENVYEKRKRIKTIGIVLFSAIGFPVLLRGFAATIHSAVYDSTLRYYDPMYIVPPFHLGVMLFSLFLITFSLVIFSVPGIILLHRKVTETFRSRMNAWISLGVLFFVFIFFSILVGLIQPNMLMGQWERLAYIAGFALAALFISERIIERKTIFSVRTIALLLATSSVSLLYPLEKKVHEFDRSHAEYLASNIFRPADMYLTLLTQQAVRELSTKEVGENLNKQQSAMEHKLAFKAWAQSILSKEGYNCSVTYFNSKGNPVSLFSIGADWAKATIQKDSLAFRKGVTIEDRSINSRLVRIYSAYSPITGEEGELLGGVSIELTAGKQALLEGETPEFLRNYTSSELEARHRTIVYSEYTNGELTYSSSPVFHTGISLPDTSLAKENSEGFWVEQQVDTLSYETYLFHTDDSLTHSTWRALSMKQLDISWHLYHILRVALFLALCSFVLSLIIYVIFILRGKRLGFSFRTKLIGAFFIVALIPTAILAYYNRQYAVDQLAQTLIDQLNRETTTIVSGLESQWGINTPFELQSFSDIDASYAASDYNIQFTLFDREVEAASSTPELFRAELFDRRMSSDVFLNVVLRQKNFYYNVQSIGTIQYIVGYKPLISDAGKVFAVVGVPTLFRLREIDRELVRRNAYLFGAFVFAMLIALFVGFVFSQQISSPIRRMYLATQKIGTGDLNVRLRSKREDELGELERSFDKMLQDLKQSQEAMMKAQRELAWKEMAKQVAHEIKNPLTPMKLSVQHLRQAHVDNIEDFDKLLHQVTGTILEQIETLNRIASEFSHFARMPERKIEENELHRIMRDVTDLFGEYTNVIFDLQFCPNSPIILADKEELRRAIMNIVRNAIQAMNERGTILIQTSIRESSVLVSIQDSGTGIAPEIQSRLFEPNFSTKNDGMGLGLAIVKKTIDDLGGSIAIESELNKGTSVRITLPLVRSN